jgi:uncharacterized protein YfaS (alpha-2-macroglobulin family)
VDEIFAPDLQGFDQPPAGAPDNGTLALALPRAPDSTHPLRAEVQLEVSQPDGRASRPALNLPVRAAGTLVAIRPGFENGAINENTEAGFGIAAVSASAPAGPLWRVTPMCRTG